MVLYWDLLNMRIAFEYEEEDPEDVGDLNDDEVGYAKNVLKLIYQKNSRSV